MRFGQGVSWLHGHGVTQFVEVGPDAVLTAMVFNALPDAEISVPVAVLRAGHDEPTTTLSAVGQVFVGGHEVDWSAVVPVGVRVGLPTYAFQRQRFWLSGSAAGDPVGLGQRGTDHPLLGAAVEAR